MNRMEIANLFIKAAVVDRRLPINERPARLKAAWVPFTHSAKDLNSRMVTNARSEKLTEGDDPFNEWMHHFWDADRMRLRPEDIADWERCNELIKLVADEGNRRALWNWAIAKAGGREFVKWCRHEGIHEMTGSRRKDRAITIIEQHLVRGASPDNEIWLDGMLPVGPVFEHISDNIAADAPSRKERNSYRDADTVFCKEAAVFDWREIRNAQRRQREARRRQAA